MCNVIPFCISQAGLFNIFPMSLYYQNTRTCSGPSSELLVCGVIHWHCTTRHRPTSSETPASIKSSRLNKPLSRRLDCRDRTIQSEPSETKGGNMYYVTMQITFLTRKFRNVEHNLHCDVGPTTHYHRLGI